MQARAIFIRTASAALALAGTLAVGTAHADPVYWQVGVDTAIDGGARINTRVGNYRDRTVVVAPAPTVVVAPQPVYVEPRRRWREPVVEYHPQPVVYAQPVVYHRPVIVVPGRGYGHGHWKHHHRHHHGHGHHHGHDRGRDWHR